MTQLVVVHRRGDDAVDARSVAEALTPAGTAGAGRHPDEPETGIEAIVTADLEKAFARLAEYSRTDTVVVSSSAESELRERVEATGNRFLGRIDPRFGAELAPAAAARVVASAVRARLAAGPSPSRDAVVPSVSDERVLVVDAVTAAADLATATDVTLVSATATSCPPGVELIEGRVEELSREGDALVATVRRSRDAKSATVQSDQLVWPGYDGALAGSYRVHAADERGLVADVVRFARDRRRRPVTVDPAVCAVGTKGVAGCTACRERCPYDAIELSVEGDGAVAVDSGRCIDCRGCLAACPTEAIASPRASDLSTLTHVTAVAVETGVDRSSSRLPFVGGGTDALVLAFVSEACEPVALSALSAAELPPTVPITVPRAQRVPSALVLYAVALGADGVVLVGERDEDDPRADDVEALSCVTDYANQTFAALGLGERCGSAGADRDAIVETVRTLSASASGAVEVLDAHDHAAQVSYELAATAVSTLGDDGLVPVEALGRVEVEAAGCTLCEACDELCPTGALEQPDAATLTLDPAECIGCERCLGCPESVIEVTQRVDPSELRAGRRPIVEAEGIECVNCGKTFASAAGMERLTEALDADVDPEAIGLSHCPACRRRGR